MTPQEEIAPLEDVPVDIEVELDRRVMTTREILQLEEGCVIGTSRSAGENIDIYIGGVLCGSGEIVVIESTLGVRSGSYVLFDKEQKEIDHGKWIEVWRKGADGKWLMLRDMWNSNDPPPPPPPPPTTGVSSDKK